MRNHSALESHNHENPLSSFLNSQGYVVLDGALATELEHRGADLRDPLWSAKVLIEAPDLIRAVHQDYLLAGADIITTASYQATLRGFMQRDLDQCEAIGLIELSVQLAVEARDAFWSVAENRKDRLRPLIAASVGPYGAYLANGAEYNGNYALSEQGLMDFHRPRLEALASSGADLIAFETIPSLTEARALIRLLSEFEGRTAWIAFGCRNGHHVSHGESIVECAALADKSDQIVAVGVNCTAPGYIESLIRDAVEVTSKPLIVYPNSGEIWDSAIGQWEHGSADPGIARMTRAWYESGARLIGGCCRTTPKDIAEIRAVMGKTHRT